MKPWREWLHRSTLKGQQLPRAMLPEGIGAVITKALSAAGLMKRSADVATPPRADAKPSAVKDNVGQFLWAKLDSAVGALDYKVYLPSSYAVSATRMPLIVMLHGCTQDPDDFATGTRMNTLAEQHGFVVAYPMQPARANTSKCWNWFRPDDQRRDHGEPQRIAAMTRQLIAHYRLDEQRVYVAGMSAGAAMAVILGRTYPDLFVAVAAHSGLPYRCANNVVAALTVMKSGRSIDANAATRHTESTTPMIVFHGDRDATVDHANATALIEQTVADWPRSKPLSANPAERFSEGGRVCDRVTYRDSNGDVAIDYWTVHGGGHLWSGGDPTGSHTDRTGPDASAHIVAFFESHAAAK